MAVLSRLVHTSPLADIIDHTAVGKHLGNWLTAATSKEVRAYIRDNLETLYHPSCTARMAPLSEGGVVNARLKVHGIHGLRIVDASIFPTIISGHTVRSFIFILFFFFRPNHYGALVRRCLTRWRVQLATIPMPASRHGTTDVLLFSSAICERMSYRMVYRPPQRSQ